MPAAGLHATYGARAEIERSRSKPLWYGLDDVANALATCDGDVSFVSLSNDARMFIVVYTDSRLVGVSWRSTQDYTEDLNDRCHRVLYLAILEARELSGDASHLERIHQLMDAIHNIPLVMSGRVDVAVARAILEQYDERWGSGYAAFLH